MARQFIAVLFSGRPTAIAGCWHLAIFFYYNSGKFCQICFAGLTTKTQRHKDRKEKDCIRQFNFDNLLITDN